MTPDRTATLQTPTEPLIVTIIILKNTARRTAPNHAVWFPWRRTLNSEALWGVFCGDLPFSMLPLCYRRACVPVYPPKGRMCPHVYLCIKSLSVYLVLGCTYIRGMFYLIVTAVAAAFVICCGGTPAVTFFQPGRDTKILP